MKKRPKVSKLLIHRKRMRRKVSQSQELVLSKTQIREEYISRTKEIDDLRREGKIKESFDKLIDLHFFLEFNDAIELHTHYYHPASKQSLSFK